MVYLCVGYTNNITYSLHVDRERWWLMFEHCHLREDTALFTVCMQHRSQMGRIGSKMKEMTKGKRYSYQRYWGNEI